MCIWKIVAQESETYRFSGPDSALGEVTGEEKRPEMDGGAPAMLFATLRIGNPWVLCPKVIYSIFLVMGGNLFMGAMFV